MIEDLQLADIHTTNEHFSWQNKCSGTRHIASRLDRFLVSESTLVGEGEIGATVLPIARSDHWSIYLEWGWLGEFVKRPFRFENFFLLHPNFQGLMKEWWIGFNGA